MKIFHFYINDNYTAIDGKAGFFKELVLWNHESNSAVARFTLEKAANILRPWFNSNFWSDLQLDRCSIRIDDVNNYLQVFTQDGINLASVSIDEVMSTFMMSLQVSHFYFSWKPIITAGSSAFNIIRTGETHPVASIEEKEALKILVPDVELDEGIGLRLKEKGIEVYDSFRNRILNEMCNDTAADLLLKALESERSSTSSKIFQHEICSSVDAGESFLEKSVVQQGKHRRLREWMDNRHTTLYGPGSDLFEKDVRYLMSERDEMVEKMKALEEQLATLTGVLPSKDSSLNRLRIASRLRSGKEVDISGSYDVSFGQDNSKIMVQPRADKSASVRCDSGNLIFEMVSGNHMIVRTTTSKD